MPDPETTVEDAPRYSPENLHDPATRAQVLAGFRPIGGLNSEQLDEKVQEALDLGLLKRNPGGDTGPQPDDTFGGVELVAGAPEDDIQRLLVNMKNLKQEAIRDEQASAWRGELVSLTTPEQRAAALHSMVERAYRAKIIQLTEAKAEVLPGKDPVKNPGHAAVPAEIVTADRRQLAAQQAFDIIVNELKAIGDPDIETKFHEMLDDVSKRGVAIEKDETERRATAKAAFETEKVERAERARKSAAKAYEDAHHENATRNVAALRGRDRVRHFRQEAEMLGASGKGATRQEVLDMRNDAHAVAIAEARKGGKDSRVAGMDDVRLRYEALIKAEPDVNIKRQLVEQRETAITAEMERLDKQSKAKAERKVEATNKADEMRAHTVAREKETSTIRADDATPFAEEMAVDRHNALGLESTPFHEVKRGGLFHFRSKRGPKVVEAWFRSPGNENLMVLERRNRRSGDLLSQTIITTEKPIRKRGGVIQLPPREVGKTVDEVRKADRLQQVKGKGGVATFLGGSLSPAEFVSFANNGFGSGKSIDGGIEADSGVYKKRYGATNNELSTFQRERKRRGGFWYTVTGGRW